MQASAPLLPFGDIAEKTEQALVQEFGNTNGISREYMRVNEASSIESGLFIPVWNLYGKSSTIDHGGAVHDDTMGHIGPYITLNAMDGSYIEPLFGNVCG